MNNKTISNSASTKKRQLLLLTMLKSTIGRKIVMSVTGLLFCLFLIGHLVGNLLLYVSAESFNKYSDKLTSTNLIYIVELGLIGIILIHIWMAITLTIENNRARPVKYKVRKTAGESTLMSRTMIYTGSVILIFIVLHVAKFKFGPWDNKLIEHPITLYDHVVNSFSNPWYSGFYVVCMVLLGFHLNHAIKSSMVTLGIARESTMNLYSTIGLVFSVIITVGFSSFPIYFFIQTITK